MTLISSADLELVTGSPPTPSRPARHALDPIHLLPISEGIAASDALWEPLARDGQLPVRLFASDTYDVWLETHQAQEATSPSTAGTTHVVTPLLGELTLHHGGGADATLPARRAAIVPPGHHISAPAESTPAIHVYSPKRAMAAVVSGAGQDGITTIPARFPTAIASVLTHPSQRSARR